MNKQNEPKRLLIKDATYIFSKAINMLTDIDEVNNTATIAIYEKDKILDTITFTHNAKGFDDFDFLVQNINKSDEFFAVLKDQPDTVMKFNLLTYAPETKLHFFLLQPAYQRVVQEEDTTTRE